MKLPLSVIILTYNEEKNIEDCIKSVYGWIENIFIVDSYSKDKTLKIAKKYGCNICQHPFENYAEQRNWALKNLPIKTNWVLNLDADHRVTPELKGELLNEFSKKIPQDLNGFIVSRKTIFLGKWIKHGGHYPTYHAILFRKSSGFCEDRLYDQHFIINGRTKILKGDIVDIVSGSLSKFIERHKWWATLDAAEQVIEHDSNKKTVKPSFFGNKIQKKRSLRNFYNKFPLFIRAFLYFIYRYIIQLGFLDGKEGLIWHSVQGFWYKFLVDARIYEIRRTARKENKPVKEVIKELYGLQL